MNIYNPFKKNTSLQRQLLNGFRDGLMDFGQLIGGLINAMVLSIVYVLGIGASVLIAKLKRKRLLDRSSGNKDSYYLEIKSEDEGLDKLIKQF